MTRRIFSPDSAIGSVVWYAALTCLLTWPVVRYLGSAVPDNLGDPLLNGWILGWDASHFLQLLHGRSDALTGFWNANIYYPEPLTLAYSEHLIAQALQILPVYALTGNLILCYNLLLLSTFVLSALGTFLLVRELTGDGRAAFVAGLLYGFALCRAQHLGHLQVLSSQWMPFVFFALRRYFTTRRWPALAGAAGALVTQHLSCGYYLLYFEPFVAGYVLYELWIRRLLRDRRTWLSLVVASAVVALLTFPFLLPYRAVRNAGMPARDAVEVDHFSADVYSYVTAYPGLHLWGSRLQIFPRSEALLFFGVTPLVLSLLAVAVVSRRACRAARGVAAARAPWLPRGFAFVAAGGAVAAAVVLVAGRRLFPLETVDPSLARVSTYVSVTAVGVIGVLSTSARARALFRGDFDLPGAGFYIVSWAAAVWLSFGRYVRSMGYRVSGPTVYDLLYRYVPGFDGVRVPARYSMLSALFMALLAGFGAAAITKRGRTGRAIVLALGGCFLVESAAIPLPVHGVWSGVNGEPDVNRGAAVVYRYVNTLPASAVLIEFPFHADAPDALYMFGSTLHWRRLVNGYSGWRPPAFKVLADLFARVDNDSDRAWRALIASGATHAIVHENLFVPIDNGRRTSAWLRRSGAREVFDLGANRVFALPPTQSSQ